MNIEIDALMKCSDNVLELELELVRLTNLWVTALIALELPWHCSHVAFIGNGSRTVLM